MTTSVKSVRARRLSVEGLEDRLNLSSYISGGDLVVSSSNFNDTVTVSYETWYGTGYYKVVENGSTSWFYASSVWGGDVYFYGYSGNDYFNNYTGLRTTAYGHGGNDTLIGSWNNDYLDGGLGSDYLYGYGGSDTLYAGYDYNWNVLDGGSGNDSLYGGYATDYLYGQAGNDYLYGNWGKDYLYGGNGNDTLDGADDGSSDYLDGGSGQDWYQREMYYYRGFLYNRETNAGYTSGWDAYYG